jgi:hypothetical protein
MNISAKHINTIRTQQKMLSPLKFRLIAFFLRSTIGIHESRFEEHWREKNSFSDLNEQKIYETNICLSDIYYKFMSP